MITADDVLRWMDDASDEQNIFHEQFGEYGIDLGLYNGAYATVVHTAGDYHDQILKIVTRERQLAAEETARLVNQYRTRRERE